MRILFTIPSRASQWIIFLISVLAATAVTFFLVSGINAFSQISQIFFAADSLHLKESFIYTTFYGFQYSSEDKQIERKKILSVDGVQDVNIVSTYTLTFPTLDQMSVTCINYDDTILRDVRVNISEGNSSLMGQKNQVFLPTYCENYCKLGDTLPGFVNYTQENGTTVEVPISVYVAGFLAEKPILQPFSGGTGLDLVSILSTHTGMYWGDIPIDNGVVWGLSDRQGEIIPPKYSDMFIIRTDGVVSMQACEYMLDQIVESPALLHNGDTLINKHIDLFSKEIGMTIALLITALGLSFSILTATTALELVYRQKEMAILYLSGASWNQCLWSVLMSQILPMLLGFPLGLLILDAKNFINLFYFLQPKLVWPEVLLALGLEILFVSAAVLPFRFLSKFKTPHELFRKD